MSTLGATPSSFEATRRRRAAECEVSHEGRAGLSMESLREIAAVLALITDEITTPYIVPEPASLQESGGSINVGARVYWY